LPFFFSYKVIDWHESLASVFVDLQATGPAAVMGFVGAPAMENVVTYLSLGAGTQTIQLSGEVMHGLLISSNVTVTAVRGIACASYSAADDWEKIEIVGLPVDPSQWGGVGQHASNQGLVTALQAPKSAAQDRLFRGTPPVGWEPLLAPGFPAPPWVPPNPSVLIDEVNKGLLDSLRPILAIVPPNQQAAQSVDITVPPPENSSGQQMSGGDRQSKVFPLAIALIGISTDPFLSLVLGFGTAYPFALDLTKSGALRQFDYMITARWERGLDGVSPSTEYAAIIPRPKFALTPASPANMISETMGFGRPTASDGQWTASIRASWDRLPEQNLFRVSSFGAATAGVAPPSQAIAMMEKRVSGGFHPIATNENPQALDPEWWRIHSVARELSIPQNPGWRTIKCAAATQDLFGLWSPWVTTDHTLAQPNLDSVRIVSVEVTPTLPPLGSICPASLTIEFLWDWRIRRPQKIRFAGLLYPAAFISWRPSSQPCHSSRFTAIARRRIWDSAGDQLLR
jgi:hypothetical protein